jgi:Mn-dependent DtxR family transcriptional regulator
MKKFLHLTEAEQQELERLAEKTDDASLDRFCELLSKETVGPGETPIGAAELREAIKRYRPEWTGAQIDVFMRGY